MDNTPKTIRDQDIANDGSGGIAIGVDVGSTTVKTVVVKSADRSILWSAYERHETHLAEKVFLQLTTIENILRDPAHQLLEQLSAVGQAFPNNGGLSDCGSYARHIICVEQ